MPHITRSIAGSVACMFVSTVLSGCASQGSLFKTAVNASARPLPGQVIVDSADASWFKYQGGGSFFMCGPGDPEGFLYRGKRNADGTRNGDQDALIDKLIGTGANCVYVMAVRSHGGDAPKDKADPDDPKFQNPFVDGDPTKDLSQPILDQWDAWFTRMDQAGITIVFFFYDDSASIWQTKDSVGADERRFIHGLVNRLQHHRHLIWCVAEEYEERFTPARVSAIAATIRDADDHDHPIAVHKLHGLEFSEFADNPNIDQFAIQYNVETPAELHAAMVQAWQAAGGRYNLNLAEVADHGTGRDARLRSWAIAMGGAYVMVLGMDIANTDPADLADCGRLVRFFEAIPLTGMAPHDELAANGTRYVLAKPPARYIAYAAHRDGPIGVKDMSAGVYNLTWLDIPTGRTVDQNGVKVLRGDQSWSPPPGIGNELAVDIQRVAR